MLNLIIRRREFALSRRDTNRHVRPFEWGIEHLVADGTKFDSLIGPRLRSGSIDNHPVSDGSVFTSSAKSASAVATKTEPTPREFLHQYADEALANSDTFFAAPGTDDYKLEGDRLTFPSAINSVYPENNTVHARFFPVESRGRAVIVLPQWNADSESHVVLCRLLNRFGITALRLSLPYHDARKPPHLVRAEYLVCTNVGLTIQANRQAVLDVRRAADWLESQGYTELGIMGTSIGSCVAFLSLAHDERFKTAVFNHGSSYFADVVWKGISTKHVRQGLEPHIDLPELRKFWSILSPQAFIQRLRGRAQKSLIISGRYDMSFPPDLTEQVIDEFKRQQVPYDRVILPCGHYTIGKFPFNVFDGFLITKYLRKHV